LDSVYAKRAKRLRSDLEDEGLKGAVIVPGPNMRYYTGVNSLLLERPFMLMIPVEGDPHLVAPTLESGPYLDGTLKMKVHPWTDSEGSSDSISKAVKGAGVKGKWGVEGKVPFLFLEKLLKKSRIKPRSAEPILQGIREIKDEEEVKLLKKSASILSRAYEKFPGLIKEGMSELELAKAASDAIFSEGATTVDDMLVQFGPSAADPHSLPSGRKLQTGDGIIIDVGSTFQGYFADVTRTFCLGSSPDLERVYGQVLEAETAGVAKAGEKVKVGDVDAAARGTLMKAGMGKFFTNRTGHGLGLEVHEAPYIVEGGEEKLRQNMFFTVEPGVYLRGKLGVRIEDDVMIQGGKGAAITDTPKEFGWWR
jgi:Xaa-Pro aminopeptidase